MLHEPAGSTGRDPAASYKARLGLRMFAVYSVFYAGFVALNLLSPPTMATVVMGDLNLATVYGIALIVVALVQALVYNVMCRRKEAELAGALPGPDDPQAGSDGTGA
jgi:uncharacterized membrane protein (DUF485 family)